MSSNSRLFIILSNKFIKYSTKIIKNDLDNISYAIVFGDIVDWKY